MAAIVRCDNCRKVSDEAAAGYIGRKFEVTPDNPGRYAKVNMTITAHSDYCIDCIKKLIADGRVKEETRD